MLMAGLRTRRACLTFNGLLYLLFLSEKTLQASQVQHPPAEIRLGQEGQQTFSLGKHNIDIYTQSSVADVDRLRERGE